jgi:hypothetical protein
MRPLRSRSVRAGAAAALGAAVLLGGCGTARIILRTPRDGVIELEGDHNKAMEQANEEMAAQCGSNFIVVREGDEPVAATAASPSAAAPVDGPTAYRVHYECGDGGALGAVPTSAPRY